MTPLRALDPSQLTGAWHVVATTLPFWRGRRDPIITYSALPDGLWLDVVSYKTSSGTPKSVVGVDTAKAAGQFLWRGSGWLGWCSSRWCFLDADDNWALTWFSAATLGVTPEGFDIYSRSADVAKAQIADYQKRVETLAGRALGSGWFLTLRGARTDGGQPLR